MRGLGWVAILRGDLDVASDQVGQALAIWEWLDAREGIADCVRSQGDIARLRLDWDRSAACFRRAMEMWIELGSRAKYSENLHGLAEVRRLQGRLEDAEQAYLRSAYEIALEQWAQLQSDAGVERIEAKLT